MMATFDGQGRGQDTCLAPDCTSRMNSRQIDHDPDQSPPRQTSGRYGWLEI